MLLVPSEQDRCRHYLLYQIPHPISIASQRVQPKAMVSFTSSRGLLLLRTPEISDTANIVSRVQDPARVECLPHLKSAKITDESTQERVVQWRKTSGKEDLFLIIERSADGTVVGDGGYETLHLKEKTGEAGIILNSGPDVRGKGYAIEALESILDYGFRELGLDKKILRTLEANAPMKRLLEMRMGFDLNLAQSRLEQNVCLRSPRKIGSNVRAEVTETRAHQRSSLVWTRNHGEK